MVITRITAKVNGCLKNSLGSVASSIIGVLQVKVDRNVEDAMSALEELNKYQESSGGPFSGIVGLRHKFRTSRYGMIAKRLFSKPIPEALMKAESCSDMAFHEAFNNENYRINIETHLKFETISPPRTKEDRFVPQFDCHECGLGFLFHRNTGRSFAA